jgi:hypothetical protein
MLRTLARMAALGGIVVIASDAGGAPLVAGGGARTQITIWASAPGAGAFGGATYGGVTPTTGAMISEQREIEVSATGEVRLQNVASTADPASVQLRDLTEPGASITEQRFLPGATTPTELIARHVGEQLTVTTAKGDVGGVLRAIDDHVVVLELGTGDQRRTTVLRRDHALDIRFAGASSDKPSLAWRIASKKPGKHSIELSYRAAGMSWDADYLAVLDEPGKQLDFSAWATIKNATGVTFDQTELVLVNGGTVQPPVLPNARGARPSPAPDRFTVPAAVRLGTGDTVQLELMPPRLAAKVRPIVTYEAMPDPAAEYQTDPNVDCTAFNGTGMGSGRAELALELDVPAQTRLPEGRVRLFHRRATRLEVVSEDQLHTAAGLARIRLSPGTEITGERRAVSCNIDERAHTLQEKIEVKIENKGAQPADVVVREFMWRWMVWRLDSEDHKGVRVAPQTHEYRLRVPAKGTQSVTYSVVYAW